MACGLNEPHDCANVRAANSALRRHLDAACVARDDARALLARVAAAYSEGAGTGSRVYLDADLWERVKAFAKEA